MLGNGNSVFLFLGFQFNKWYMQMLLRTGKYPCPIIVIFLGPTIARQTGQHTLRSDLDGAIWRMPLQGSW